MRDMLWACITGSGDKQTFCNVQRYSRLTLRQCKFAPDASRLSFKKVARLLFSWHDGFEYGFCTRKLSSAEVGQRQIRCQISDPDHRANGLRLCQSGFQTGNCPVGFKQQEIQLSQRTVAGGDPLLVFDGCRDSQRLLSMGKCLTEVTEGG